MTMAYFPMIVRCILTGLSLVAFARGAEEPMTLERVLREVGEQHPQVRAARALAQAEREKIAQASAWEDPTVGAEMMRESSLRLNRYSAIEWSVAQKLPVTSQRKRRTELAKAEAAVAASNVSAQLTPLLIQATDAFFHLVHARELLNLTKGNDEVLAQALRATQARLADGGGNVLSVLLAETERARLQEQVIGYEREITEATTMLNTLRNLPTDAPIGLVDVASVHRLRPIESFDALRTQALANRPELRVAEAKVTVAERATDVARAWIPDPEVTVRARTVKGNSDPISEYDTGIAISVPWFNRGKYGASIREAKHRRDAAEQDVATLRSQTLAELRDAWAKYDAADRLVKLQEEKLVPLAERAVTAAQAGLDSGKSSLLELIAAQKNLRDARNALVVAWADRARATAALGAMTGQNLLTTP